MRTEKLLKALQAADAYWLKELARYSNEELAKKLRAIEWSMGQLYSHLLFANGEYFIKKLAACISGNATFSQKPATLPLKLILFFNGLPPKRYKVPRSLSGNEPKELSREQIEEKFKAIHQKAEALFRQIDSANPANTLTHLNLGGLNARQWAQFMLIHQSHHLMQKKRLDDYLGKA